MLPPDGLRLPGATSEDLFESHCETSAYTTSSRDGTKEFRRPVMPDSDKTLVPLPLKRRRLGVRKLVAVPLADSFPFATSTFSAVIPDGGPLQMGSDRADLDASMLGRMISREPDMLRCAL